MAEALGAVQDAVHLAVEQRVVIWLDVQHKVLIGHAQVARKWQIICPAQPEVHASRICL